MNKTIGVLLVTSIVSGCGGSSGGGDTTAPVLLSASAASASMIDHSDALSFVFDESLDPAAIILTGTMAAQSDGGVLSTTTVAGDTLTISPSATWTGGFDRTLNITVADTAGNTITEMQQVYSLLLKFDNFQPASVVIGQADFTSTSEPHPTAKSLNETIGIEVANGHLYIGGESNPRVTIYNSIPSANHASADSVLGQVDLLSDVRANPPTASSLEEPYDIGANSSQLFIADSAENRVLIYPNIPTTGPVDASVVLGQAAMNTDASACTATGMNNPHGVHATDDKVIVAEDGNNRVLIWNSIPTTNGAAPDLVLGQPDFTTCTFPGAATASALAEPNSVWTDGTRLMVTDTGHERVLIWNTFPTTNNQAADVVVGQADFISSGSAATDMRFNLAESQLHSNGVQLCVADTSNNRVMIWNSIPTTNGQAADVVIGQSDFDALLTARNDDNQDGVNDGVPTARTIAQPYACYFSGSKLIVTSYPNGRALVYESN